MKKVFFIIFVSAIFGLLVMPVTAMAAWGTSVTIGGKTIEFSKNVQGDVVRNNPTTAGGTDYQTYSAATYNGAGTKMYGVASNSTKVKWKYCDNNDGSQTCAKANPSDPLGNGDSSDFTGWSDV